MKRIMKISLSVLLALTLLVPTSVAAAAENAVGTTLRLEKTEGTVTIKNASGNEVTKREGMRLYSGYAASTAKSSYAYVSLDSTKAVKLDASSTSEVQRSGNKLELIVTEGNLFFNVTKPLDTKESLTIRTSTMVTGIRGTAGYVEILDRYTSRLVLLEGSASVTTSDPLTGQTRTQTIHGGQSITAVFHDGSRDHVSELIIEQVEESNIPGFVAVEVKRDSALQQRITEKSPLSVPEIIRDAEERLETDERTAEARDKQIQQKLEQIRAEDVDPIFQTYWDDSDSSWEPDPAPTPTPDPAPDPEPDVEVHPKHILTIRYVDQSGVEILSSREAEVTEGRRYESAPATISGYVYMGLHAGSDPSTGVMDGGKEVIHVYLPTTINLVDPTSSEMAEALATFEPYLDNLGNGRATLNVSGTIRNNNENTTMHVPSYFDVNFTTTTLEEYLTLDLEDGSTLTVSTSFTNQGTISGEGTMTVAAGATVTNNGTLAIESTNSMHVFGTLHNQGRIAVGNADTNGASIPGKLVIESGGTLISSNGASGKFTVSPDSILTVDGTVITSDTIVNEGSMTVTGTITGSGLPTSTPYPVLNMGDLTVSGGTVRCTDVSADANYRAIHSDGGTINIQAGEVSGTAYGISSHPAGGTITISGGTVSGDTAVQVASSVSLSLTGGTLAGVNCGIDNEHSDATNVTMSGGTVSVSAQTASIINGNITFTSGTLEADYDVFTGKPVTSALQLPQPSNVNGKYTIVRDDNSVYTFTEFASNLELTSALELGFVKTINLMAGGELTDNTEATVLASDKTLNVKGGTLTVAEGAGLSVDGTVNVSSGAGVTCEGTLGSSNIGIINNNGTFLVANAHPTYDERPAYRQEYTRAAVNSALNYSELRGAFTNGSTGTLSIGAEDSTGNPVQYAGINFIGNLTNNGDLYVAPYSTARMRGNLTNNGDLTVDSYAYSYTDPNGITHIYTCSAVLELDGTSQYEPAQLVNNGPISVYGRIETTDASIRNGTFVYTDSGAYVSGGEIRLASFTGDSALILNDGDTLTNLGKFYIENGRTASIHGTFTNSNFLSVMGTLDSRPGSTMTNASTGSILVGDFDANDTFDPGIWNLRGSSGSLAEAKLENLGAIYVSPRSTISNQGVLHNAGFLELGTDGTGIYAGVILAEDEEDANLYNYGTFWHGYTADGSIESGHLELLSGEFTNNHTLDCSAKGYINSSQNRTHNGSLHNTTSYSADGKMANAFINRNQNNLPTGNFTLFNSGKYVDDVTRGTNGDVYMMVMDYQNHNKVVAYKPTSDLLTTNGFAWIGDFTTYRLIPCGATSVTVDGTVPAVVTATLEDTYANPINLDLNDCTLILSSPLQIGVELLNDDGETPSGTILEGQLHLQDDSENGGGILTVSNSEEAYQYGAFNENVVVVKAGELRIFTATVKLDVPEFDCSPSSFFAPIYMNAYTAEREDGGIQYLSETDVSLYNSQIICGTKENTVGSGIAAYRASGEIFISNDDTMYEGHPASSITAGGDAIYIEESDLYRELTVAGGSRVTSYYGNGIAMSGSDVPVRIVSEGTVVSGLYSGITSPGEGKGTVNINIFSGTVSGLDSGIYVANGTYYDAQRDEEVANRSSISISGGLISSGEAGCGILAEDGTKVTITGGEIVGYTGISAQSGDGGTANVTVSGGTITGAGSDGCGIYASEGTVKLEDGVITSSGDGLYLIDSSLTMSGGSVTGESNGIWIDDPSTADSAPLTSLSITGGTIASTKADSSYSGYYSSGYGILYTYQFNMPSFTIGETTFAPNDLGIYEHGSDTFSDTGTGTAVTGGTIAIGIYPLDNA